MAVAFLFEGTGVSVDAYDAVMSGIGRATLDAPLPDGIISHIAGPTAAGWRVVDVWESDEQAGRFYGSDAFQRVVAERIPGVQPDRWQLHRIEVAAPVKSVETATP